MTGFTDSQVEFVASAAFHDHTRLMPYMIGLWLDTILLGVLVVLFISWLQRGYSTERKWTKALMIYLLIVSLGHSIYILAYQTILFVFGFGTYATFLDPLYHRVFWLLNCVSRVPAASWFAHRAWCTSGRSLLLPITITPLLAASVGCAIAAYFTPSELPLPPNSLEHAFVAAFCCTGLAADFINTFTIALGLYRSKTGRKSTDSIITYLLITLAETQLPPTLAALSFLIGFAVAPNNSILYCWQGIAKVHVICLVIVVNSRIKLRAMIYREEVHEMAESKLQVSVETTTEVHTSDQHTMVVPYHSHPDSKGQIRSANGRLVGGGEGDYWMQLASKTSLV